MKKIIMKRSIFIVVFILLFCVLTDFMKISEVSTVASVRGFYKEPKNSIDVVCIGASEVYTGYMPTEAWKELGYTSYDLCVAGAPGSIYKSMLKEVLKRQKPQVVVFEVNGFVHNDAYFQREGKLHNWIDEIPWSKNRIETIKELIPKEKRMEYYVPMLTHHSNWKHPKGCLYRFAMKAAIDLCQTSNLKGFATLTKRYDERIEQKESVMEFTQQSRKYLTELLEYCQSVGLKNVVFTRFPHERLSSGVACLEEIKALVNSYGYDFLNAEQQDDIRIDRTKDFYNKEHLNLDGAKKMTAWLGNYIVRNYNVNCNTSDAVVKRWVGASDVSDKVLTQCQKDLGNGVVRHYLEASVYIQLPQSKSHQQIK